MEFVELNREQRDYEITFDEKYSPFMSYFNIAYPFIGSYSSHLYLLKRYGSDKQERRSLMLLISDTLDN